MVDQDHETIKLKVPGSNLANPVSLFDKLFPPPWLRLLKLGRHAFYGDLTLKEGEPARLAPGLCLAISSSVLNVIYF